MDSRVGQRRLEEAGSLFMRRGLPIAALHHWSAWLDETRREDDTAGFVRASNAMAAAHVSLRDAESAERQLKEALTAVESTVIPSEDRVKTHLNLSITLFRRGDLDGALAAALEAREISGVGAGLPVSARVQLTLSGLHVARKEWVQARRATDAAAALADIVHDRRLLSRALNNRAMVLLHEGSAAEAESALERAIALASEEGRPGDLAWPYTEMAHVKLRLGDAPAAYAWATRALDAMWSDVGVLEDSEAARLSRLFGLLAREAGEREQAIVWLNRAAAYYAQSGLMSEWKQVSDQLAEVLSAPRRAAGATRLHIPTRTRDRIQYITSLLSLTDSITSLQPNLGLHSALVTQYALRLGERLGLAPADLQVLSHAGRFHDIGKIVVAMPPLPRREDVIGSPDDERVRLHPKTGRDMLAMFPLPAEVVQAVADHHERWDGGGYPDHRRGSAISRPARIIQVANLYIGLTRDAHPEPPLAHDGALDLIAREAGRGLDPEAAAAFLALHDPGT